MSVTIFKDLFKGRTDVYGINQFCLKEEPTSKIYSGHLSGVKRIGIYPILQDNTTNWLAIDIDDGDFDKALRFKKRSAHYDMHSYIERSKSKGYHVWTFFEKPIPAVDARLIAEFLSEEAEFKAEIFPKQDEITERNPFGNFIFLPLFGPDARNDKTIFVTDENKTFIKNPDGLSRIKKTPVAVVNDIIATNNLIRKESFYAKEDSDVVESAKISKGILPCIEKIKEGKMKNGDGRNECSFRLAIFYKERGMSKEEVSLLLLKWDSLNKDELGPHEITNTIESVFRGRYKSYGCDSALIQKFCDKENCPFIHAQDRKRQIDEGIITLVFRDPASIVFRKKDYEYRITNLEFAKSGKLKATLSLSSKGSILCKDVISLDKATQRKRFVLAAKDPEVDLDIIKIEDLVRKQIEKEEKEKLEKPKQLYVMTENEKKEAVSFLENTPHLLSEVIKTTNNMGVVGEETVRLMVYLAFTSRITEAPISITVKGESSSGKSFGCQCVKKLIPEEGYHFITRATQQAFYHLPEDGMRHKIIYINELPGSESADYSIRTAQSEGDLVLMLPVKDPVTGDMETKEKRVKGPCGFLVTTTQPAGHAENETRNFSIFTDDSPGLTRKIGDITSRKALGEEFNVDDRRLNLFKNTQRLLNPDFKVVIPYAREVFGAFPDKPVRIRRDRERFRELISIITILHQFHRKQVKRDNNFTILEATLADYYIARMVAGDTLLHTIYEFGPCSKQIWDALKEMEDDHSKETTEDGFPMTESMTFKYKDVAQFLGWKVQKTKKWSLTLLNAGIVEYAESSTGGRGKAAIMQLAKSTSTGRNVMQDDEHFLPKIEDLWEKFPCNPDLFYHPITGQKIDPEMADAPNMAVDEELPF